MGCNRYAHHILDLEVKHLRELGCIQNILVNIRYDFSLPISKYFKKEFIFLCQRYMFVLLIQNNAMRIFKIYDKDFLAMDDLFKTLAHQLKDFLLIRLSNHIIESLGCQRDNCCHLSLIRILKPLFLFPLCRRSI